MAKKNKTTKTTQVFNVTITHIVDGDTGDTFNYENMRKAITDNLETVLGADNVTVEYVKAFVMEE